MFEESTVPCKVLRRDIVKKYDITVARFYSSKSPADLSENAFPLDNENIEQSMPVTHFMCVFMCDL